MDRVLRRHEKGSGVGWVSPTRPPTPILVAQIDLYEQFKEFMHVGLSASNGQGSGIHIVDHWQFKT